MSIFVIFIQREYPSVVWLVLMPLNIQYRGIHTHTHIILIRQSAIWHLDTSQVERMYN